MVFTCQGGCEGHAEAIISRIATGIAKCEGVDAATIKAEILEDISLCIGRSVVQAIQKRGKPARTKISHIQRALEEAAERNLVTADDE